jgi:asparagine synthase (glutamine-hydrolysing)
LKPMIGALAHRGPDDWGVWSDELCALGHRRLSIIDLSEAGRQPMSNARGDMLITFNGEIYNFQQLRQELEKHGHRFRTRTDTEAIIYAYEQWGVDCVSKMRGMFAFGIWDRRARRIFLARDRAGKKPLFYAQFGDCFLFASELQGILAGGDIPREVDPDAIDAYLSHGYVPAPHTAFKGVYKLPPAHYLTLDLKRTGFEKRIERYWSLDYEPKLRIGEDEACEILREKMTEAVRLRMISDVPLGAFLSGGIDSSVVVGLMAKLSGAKVKTFSIGFNEAAYDETSHARRIAERWGTDHHEFVVEPDALSILPKLVRHYGEPYADSSAIPSFYVAQMTRRQVTVALNGDGGDESFAGYERYLANYLAERMISIPGASAAARALSHIIQSWPSWPGSIDPKGRAQRARRFLAAAWRPMSERYPQWLKVFQDEAKTRLYSPEFSGLLNRHGAVANSSRLPSHPVDAAMAIDIASYLPYDLLVKVDITSMANSLEARSPFLDHEVMEFAARLPVEIKFRGGKLKSLLKRAFADLLPPENVNRRKMGFGVPVGQWFRGPLRDLLRDATLSADTLGRLFFRRQEVRRLVDEHLELRADHSSQLWNLLMLELWSREFI